MTARVLPPSEASLTITTTKSCAEVGHKGKELTMTARTEDTIALSQALCTQPDGPRSRVTMGVNTKISDSIKWGPDTYDKINYTVEIFATVSVECDQANDSIREAQNIAYDLAWDASRRSIQNAVVGHYEDIRNRLFSGYFPVK